MEKLLHTKKYRWLIGKIDEISKVCEEQYKGMQDENTRKFEDYWLNGEVLIVKMVNGKLTAKVRNRLKLWWKQLQTNGNTIIKTCGKYEKDSK